MAVAVESLHGGGILGRPAAEGEGAPARDRFPGIRFRTIDEQDGLRPHMRIFVNREQVRDLTLGLEPGDEVQILQALSGG